MNKRILMVAYHFPPMKGSSGIQRTLKFCQYLPEFGWQPIVLSAHERAYEMLSQEQMGEIPGDVVVRRGFALDTRRHLSIRGRYLKSLAIPDRWASWLLGGVWEGLRIVFTMKPRAIWSTYPIATAHLIGYALHRLTGLPWIADLRDPMAQEGYPEDPLQWKAFKWIEERIARHACAICFTSPGAIDHFMDKHGGTVAPGKLHLIENGYDEGCFAEAERLAKARPAKGPLALVHSGVVYPSERDPRPFFQALSTLKQAGTVSSESLRIVFRASGHDSYLAPIIAAADIGDIVELAPPLPYAEALAEMLAADGLVLLQAPNCNYQIPAKLYEYIRAGRPIFGLTDHEGDTAKLLQQLPGNALADISSADDIAEKLALFINHIDPAAPISRPQVEQFSRRARARQLAALLNSLIPNGNAYATQREN